MRRKRIEGQAMVELALVLPILILLICGIIDFGWIFGNQIIVNNATREAARYSAIHYYDSTSDNDQSIAQLKVQEKAVSLDPEYISVDLETDGEEIIVITHVSMPILTPLSPLRPFLIDKKYPMTAKSVMRIE